MAANKDTKPTSVSLELMRRVSNLQVDSAAALIALALEPGDVRDFALYVAALPCHRQTRKDGDYMDSKILQAQSNDKWLPRFQANLWAHYTWVVHVCHPRGHEIIDHRLDRQTTKRQRAELAGTGMVSRKKVPTTDEARRAEAATLDACRPHPCVLWLDNYNKQRFSKNPGVVPSKANRRTAPAGDTNACINGSIMAIVPCPGVPQATTVQPSVTSLSNGAKTVARNLVDARHALKSATDALRREPHHRGSTRVPCDIVRENVSMAPWRPYAVRTEGVGTTEGLLQLLDIIDGIHADTGDSHTMPLLVDVDIFYRILKLMLSETWVAYPVRASLVGRPLLFGVWHGYKHCVTRCFQHFLPFWVAIQSPTFLDAPEDTKCPRHPCLSTMETLVTGLFIVNTDAETVLDKAIADLRGDLRRRPEAGQVGPVDGTEHSPPGTRLYALKQLLCLHCLATQYVPALFLMGKWVRDCHWKLHAANTGTHVHRLLQLQATMLIALRPKKGRQQYLANTLLALLQWQPHMDTLPGMAWCEEKLESTISTLAVDAGGDMTSADAPRHHALYVTQRLTIGEVHDVSRNPMSRDYPQEVKIRLNKVVARITSLSLPFVQWGGTSETYVQGVATWPADNYAFPPDLWAPLTHADVWTDCNTAINNVVGPVRPTKQNRKSIAEARAYLERRYANEKLSLDHQVLRLMAITDFRQRAGLDDVAPRKRKRRSVVGVAFGPWQPGQRPPPPSGAPPAGTRSGHRRRPPPARRAVQQQGVQSSRSGAMRVAVQLVPSTGPDLVDVPDDGPAGTGPAAPFNVDAGLAAGGRPSPVTSDMSDDASTLSSVSTSSLSTTSVSSHSSDSGSLAWPEADVVVLPDVPSESDEWELAPDGEDETGEGEVARRLPK